MNTERPITDKQVAFIHRLLDERDLFASPTFFDAVNAMDKDEFEAYMRRLKGSVELWTMSQASETIEKLIVLPVKEGVQTRQFNDEVKVTEPGVYELEDGAVYVVKPNRDKSRLYAKRMVVINAERLNEDGEGVQIEFEYERGAIFKLKPADKMSFERAKKLTILYGHCIVCGRFLKAKESVERGIGPVCRKLF